MGLTVVVLLFRRRARGRMARERFAEGAEGGQQTVSEATSEDDGTVEGEDEAELVELRLRVGDYQGGVVAEEIATENRHQGRCELADKCQGFDGSRVRKALL